MRIVPAILLVVPLVAACEETDIQKEKARVDQILFEDAIGDLYSDDPSVTHTGAWDHSVTELLRTQWGVEARMAYAEGDPDRATLDKPPTSLQIGVDGHERPMEFYYLTGHKQKNSNLIDGITRDADVWEVDALVINLVGLDLDQVNWIRASSVGENYPEGTGLWRDDCEWTRGVDD